MVIRLLLEGSSKKNVTCILENEIIYEFLANFLGCSNEGFSLFADNR